MAKKKKQKIRTAFRKNRTVRTRDKDLTSQFDSESEQTLDVSQGERISGKGDLTRKRTVVGAETIDDDAGFAVVPDVDESECLQGRVLSVHGLLSHVQAENSQLYKCATRRLLKTLSTDQRHVVTAGDRVWFRPEGTEEGIIERVAPRRGVLSRTSRGRQHVLVTNVDQLLIIASAAEPYLKPNLIDRFLLSAEKCGIEPLVCINKVDLVDPVELQPIVGVYSQMGYRVVLISVKTGQGLEGLRSRLKDRESVVAGQSGVGKSSLLNALDPELSLRVSHVGKNSQKGRHTTTTAQLIPLQFGGYVVDTPGIRQFQLWDVIAEEVAGFFRDLRPYVSRCRYPDCTHTHETDCAVKDAVADGRIDARRYESYVQIHAGDAA